MKLIKMKKTTMRTNMCAPSAKAIVVVSVRRMRCLFVTSAPLEFVMIVQMKVSSIVKDVIILFAKAAKKLAIAKIAVITTV
mmetsp:Transcript_31982/g.46610  ORF Transcript_31982/g.46610 Transcript_31982/m.46610 type:complete len:81 (+) Transcript_31982:455-697(+)